ncbi:MAG TPA: divalent metal cation transporter [Terriglobales bacterium]|nr:divalent metal cation transporter [Terriglobales bacterium]
MRFLRRWKTRILLFLAVVGPGFITANVDNDAGGIWTYSSAGAQFGHLLLWTMIPITLALIVVQEMTARMGAVTGKGLSDLIREEFGFRITFFMMIGILITNFGNVIAEFAGIAGSLELFGLSKYITVPISCVAVWLIVVKGQYKTVEKVFLTASFFYITYIVAGVLAKPAWGDALIATIKPPARSAWLQQGYVYMVIGLVGTTIAPWMQFYLQSSIVEKGVTRRQYKASKIDVIAGCIFTDVVAWFIIVACAATLYAHGYRNVQDAKDAAQALRPLAGDYAYILFAAGLFNASLFAASILPLSTAYTVCEGLGFESGVGRKFSEAPVFYWLYTALIVAGGAVILVPNLPLVKITILSQVVNGVVLPFVLIFMLLLINKKDLMGEYVNSRFFNVIAWGTTILVIVLTFALMWQSLHGTGGALSLLDTSHKASVN